MIFQRTRRYRQMVEKSNLMKKVITIIMRMVKITWTMQDITMNLKEEPPKRRTFKNMSRLRLTRKSFKITLQTQLKERNSIGKGRSSKLERSITSTLSLWVTLVLRT
jgi:hypothetical protein